MRFTHARGVEPDVEAVSAARHTLGKRCTRDRCGCGIETCVDLSCAGVFGLEGVWGICVGCRAEYLVSVHGGVVALTEWNGQVRQPVEPLEREGCD